MSTSYYGYRSNVFMRGEHPFCERTSLDQIHGAYYFFIPMEVAFRRGAVGWRDVSATKECREAASSYCALLQFLAAMSQRVVEDHGGEMYTSTDSAGNMSAVQRFRVVCNLIVRKTHQEPGAHDKDVVDEDDDDDGCLPGSGHSHLLLPDYELLSPSNIVGVLWMIHVMDPQLSLIDVVREVVESSAPRRSAAYQQHQQRQLGDGDENENDDGDEEHERQPQPREDDADGSGVTTTSRVPHGQQPPRQQQQNTGGPDNTANKTKRPANQRKPRRTGFGGRSGRRTAERSEVFEEMVETDQRRSVPMMHNMYRKVNCLWKAIALLVDLTTGKPIISDNRLWKVDACLRRALEDGSELNMSVSLSLKNALERARAVAGPDATSAQLCVDRYFVQPLEPTAAMDETGMASPEFVVPVPELSWCFGCEQFTPEMLMASAFPWRSTDIVRTMAGIAARHLNISVDKVISECGLSAGWSSGRCDPAAGMATDSALMASARSGGEVAALLSLSVPGRGGISSRGGGGMGSDSAPPCITIEDEISAEVDTDEVKSVSALRPVGRVTAAIRSFLEDYYAAHASDPMLPSMMRVASGGRRKRHCRYSARAAKLRRLVNGIIEDEDGGRERQHLGNDDRRGDDDDDDDDSSHDEMTEAIRQLRIRCTEASGEVARAARAELVSLLDPTARIPKSVKSAYKWLDKQPSVALGFRIHSRNLGIFSQILATMMAMIRQSGVAVNELPIIMLLTSRDTGVVCHRCGLPMHLKLMGKFAAGKSKVMQFVASCSCRNAVILLNGSSLKGALPTHCSPDSPFSDVLICYDELPGQMVEKGAKLTSEMREARRQLGSWMTRQQMDYNMNIKDPKTGELKWVTKTVESNVVIAGATNAADAQEMIDARMWECFVHGNVRGHRNSTNMMCDPDWPNDQRTKREEVVTRTFKNLQTITMMVAKDIETGGLPLPDNQKYSVYMECAVEFLENNFYDIYERVRKVDSARPMAVAWTLWQCICLRYSPALCGLDDTKLRYALSDNIDLLPYMQISEEIAMIVIATVVYTAAVPVAHQVARWMAEFCGRYPFVSHHKRIALHVAKSSNDAEAEDPDEKIGSAVARIPYAELVQRLKTMPVAVLGVPMRGQRAASSSSRGKRNRGKGSNSGSGGNNNNPIDFGRNGRQQQQQQQDGNRDGGLLTEEDVALMDHYQRIGPTVEFPLNGKQETRNNLKKIARRVLKWKIPAESVGYMYKEESAHDGQRTRLLYNPNYIAVFGTKESFAHDFLVTNSDCKLTDDDVSSVLVQLCKKHVQAHMLPMVPFQDADTVMPEIERYRSRLWADPEICRTKHTAPVLIPAEGCWYVLVEMLLDSPMHIVHRTLQALCNETTIERDIVLPIADKDYPVLLRTFSARPVPRPLRCHNPSFAGPAEFSLLSQEVQAVIARNHVGDSTTTAAMGTTTTTMANTAVPLFVAWDKHREIESKRRFLSEHGCTVSPDGCVERAIHEHYVLDHITPNMPLYPVDERAQMRKADAEIAQNDEKTASAQQYQRRQHV